MKKARYDKAIREYTRIKTLWSTSLELFILVNITGSVSFADIPNICSDNASNLYKSNEVIKAFDKVIEINPQNSMAWYKKDLLYIFSHQQV